MGNLNEIEKFLNKDFFDKETREQIRKDFADHLESECNTKDTEIAANETKLLNINRCDLKSLLVGF